MMDSLECLGFATCCNLLTILQCVMCLARESYSNAIEEILLTLYCQGFLVATNSVSQPLRVFNFQLSHADNFKSNETNLQDEGP